MTRWSARRRVEHALRFTLAKSRRAYVPPASHWASNSFDDDLPPMGMRVRLKAGYDISGFAPAGQVILRALKKYGMILADNGSDNFISGAPDPRWDAGHPAAAQARDHEGSRSRRDEGHGGGPPQVARCARPNARVRARENHP